MTSDDLRAVVAAIEVRAERQDDADSVGWVIVYDDPALGPDRVSQVVMDPTGAPWSNVVDALAYAEQAETCMAAWDGGARCRCLVIRAFPADTRWTTHKAP